MPSDITTVITTVGKPRDSMLRRALHSVLDQTLLPDTIVISEDWERRGAAANRQAGTDRVQTGLVAYLDDDDEMGPDHLQRLRDLLVEQDADVVFPWYTIIGPDGQPHLDWDPVPECFGRDWAAYLAEHPTGYQFPVTFLARVDAVRAAGGWMPHPDMQHVSGEDWRLIQALIGRGARIVHLPERTWRWHHWGGNSSGLAQRVPW